MASLRKVPKVEPKNDFWIEEYRKERSKSPLPGEGNQQGDLDCGLFFVFVS